MIHADVLITSGRLLDGLGGAIESPALAICGDRLRLVDNPHGVAARATVDAAGLAVCPGFIDVHSHSDLSGLRFPRAPNRALAGITTEVVGNCGFGAFPLTDEIRSRMGEEYADLGIVMDWDDVAGYFRRQRETESAVNRAALIGHGTVRAAVMGYADRPPDADELARMRRVAEQAMAAGAFGLSTGLPYTPGCFADADEIAELAAVVRDRGGFYASHVRSEGDTLLEAVDEFLDVLRRTGVRGQLSHVKAMGPRNWHKFDALRVRLFNARDRDGLALTADRYPYNAANCSLAGALLPAWVRALDPVEMLKLLADPRGRAQIREEAWEPRNPDELARRTAVIAIRSPGLRQYQGMRLDRIGRDMGLDPFDAAIEIIIAERARCEAVTFAMDPAQTREILGWPFVMVGSDSSARGGTEPDCHDHPHPRTFGTPARFLGEFVREGGVMDWPEAIHRLCGMPARLLGLTDRGVLADGAAADLVIFDPNAIADNATYDNPAVAPSGIVHVFVNGRPIVQDGVQTDRLPGRFLTSGSGISD